MQNFEEPTRESIMRREAGYTPPRSLSHWLIGRPLPQLTRRTKPLES